MLILNIFKIAGRPTKIRPDPTHLFLVLPDPYKNNKNFKEKPRIFRFYKKTRFLSLPANLKQFFIIVAQRNLRISTLWMNFFCGLPCLQIYHLCGLTFLGITNIKNGFISITQN